MSGISPEGQGCGARGQGALGAGWETEPVGQPRWGARPGELLAGGCPERERCSCCCCCCWRISGKLQPERGQVEPETAEPRRRGEARAAGSTMPAIKKERLDREELALAAFNQPMETLPDYLAPLAAAAIPVVTPHPPAYEQLFAPHPRAYLGFPETHPPHPLAEDLMLERFSSIPDFQPFFDNGEPCIEVECGDNKALLYIHKLCQGSKGPSIRYRGEWLTPNEFQFVSGRETAKDWKRSIRHKGTGRQRSIPPASPRLIARCLGGRPRPGESCGARGKLRGAAGWWWERGVCVCVWGGYPWLRVGGPVCACAQGGRAELRRRVESSAPALAPRAAAPRQAPRVGARGWGAGRAAAERSSQVRDGDGESAGGGGGGGDMSGTVRA